MKIEKLNEKELREIRQNKIKDKKEVLKQYLLVVIVFMIMGMLKFMRINVIHSIQMLNLLILFVIIPWVFFIIIALSSKVRNYVISHKGLLTSLLLFYFLFALLS